MVTGTSLPEAVPSLVPIDTGIVHDGGIVFNRTPPEGGFAIAGRLPAQQVKGTRVRLVMASGRSMITTPAADGLFQFYIAPRGDQSFGVLSIQIDYDAGSSVPVVFESAANVWKRWIRLELGRSYGLGMLSELESAVTVGRNPLAWLDADGDGLFDAVDPDDDNDGIPDERDDYAFAFDPLTTPEAGFDWDGDGMPEWPVPYGADGSEDEDEVPLETPVPLSNATPKATPTASVKPSPPAGGGGSISPSPSPTSSGAVSPTPSPSASASVCPTPSAAASSSPSPSPSPGTSPKPSPSPSPKPSSSSSPNP